VSQGGSGYGEQWVGCCDVVVLGGRAMGCGGLGGGVCIRIILDFMYVCR